MNRYYPDVPAPDLSHDTHQLSQEPRVVIGGGHFHNFEDVSQKPDIREKLYDSRNRCLPVFR